MIHIESSVQIARPRDEVFDFLIDVDNLPKWQTGVLQSRSLTQGPVRVGFQFAEMLKVGPWKLNTVSTVTDIKVNERFAFQVKSSGPLDCDAYFDLQPVAGGTRLTMNGAARLKGIWRLLQPFLAGDLRKETRTELATIKLLLEAAAAVPSGSTI
jgi:carbon monoxide dehydrogenase subunit G